MGEFLGSSNPRQRNSGVISREAVSYAVSGSSNSREMQPYFPQQQYQSGSDQFYYSGGLSMVNQTYNQSTFQSGGNINNSGYDNQSSYCVGANQTSGSWHGTSGVDYTRDQHYIRMAAIAPPPPPAAPPPKSTKPAAPSSLLLAPPPPPPPEEHENRERTDTQRVNKSSFRLGSRIEQFDTRLSIDNRKSLQFPNSSVRHVGIYSGKPVSQVGVDYALNKPVRGQVGNVKLGPQQNSSGGRPGELKSLLNLQLGDQPKVAAKPLLDLNLSSGMEDQETYKSEASRDSTKWKKDHIAHKESEIITVGETVETTYTGTDVNFGSNMKTSGGGRGLVKGGRGVGRGVRGPVPDQMESDIKIVEEVFSEEGRRQSSERKPSFRETEKRIGRDSKSVESTEDDDIEIVEILDDTSVGGSRPDPVLSVGDVVAGAKGRGIGRGLRGLTARVTAGRGRLTGSETHGRVNSESESAVQEKPIEGRSSDSLKNVIDKDVRVKNATSGVDTSKDEGLFSRRSPNSAREPSVNAPFRGRGRGKRGRPDVLSRPLFETPLSGTRDNISSNYISESEKDSISEPVFQTPVPVTTPSRGRGKKSRGSVGPRPPVFKSREAALAQNIATIKDGSNMIPKFPLEPKKSNLQSASTTEPSFLAGLGFGGTSLTHEGSAVASSVGGFSNAASSGLKGIGTLFSSQSERSGLLPNPFATSLKEPSRPLLPLPAVGSSFTVGGDGAERRGIAPLLSFTRRSEESVIPPVSQKLDIPLIDWNLVSKAVETVTVAKSLELLTAQSKPIGKPLSSGGQQSDDTLLFFAEVDRATPPPPLPTELGYRRAPPLNGKSTKPSDVLQTWQTLLSGGETPVGAEPSHTLHPLNRNIPRSRSRSPASRRARRRSGSRDRQSPVKVRTRTSVSPRRSYSPFGNDMFSKFRRRSRSRSRRRSPSLTSKRSPSPSVRRSPPPERGRYSPDLRRSRTPLARRSRSPGVRRSLSPVRKLSPLFGRRSPRRRSPSPLVHKRHTSPKQKGLTSTLWRRSRSPLEEASSLHVRSPHSDLAQDYFIDKENTRRRRVRSPPMLLDNPYERIGSRQSRSPSPFSRQRSDRPLKSRSPSPHSLQDSSRRSRSASKPKVLTRGPDGTLILAPIDPVEDAPRRRHSFSPLEGSRSGTSLRNRSPKRRKRSKSRSRRRSRSRSRRRSHSRSRRHSRTRGRRSSRSGSGSRLLTDKYDRSRSASPHISSFVRNRSASRSSALAGHSPGTASSPLARSPVMRSPYGRYSPSPVRVVNLTSPLPPETLYKRSRSPTPVRIVHEDDLRLSSCYTRRRRGISPEVSIEEGYLHSRRRSPSIELENPDSRIVRETSISPSFADFPAGWSVRSASVESDPEGVGKTSPSGKRPLLEGDLRVHLETLRQRTQSPVPVRIERIDSPEGSLPPDDLRHVLSRHLSPEVVPVRIEEVSPDPSLSLSPERELPRPRKRLPPPPSPPPGWSPRPVRRPERGSTEEIREKRHRSPVQLRSIPSQSAESVTEQPPGTEISRDEARRRDMERIASERRRRRGRRRSRSRERNSPEDSPSRRARMWLDVIESTKTMPSKPVATLPPPPSMFTVPPPTITGLPPPRHALPVARGGIPNVAYPPPPGV